MSILYPHKNELNHESNAAFTGAILGRFPVGSSTAPLEVFVTSLGGRCGAGEHYVREYFNLSSSIPEYSTIGYVSVVLIEAKTINSVITTLRVRRTGVGL
jgi:hypothetical protein